MKRSELEGLCKSVARVTHEYVQAQLKPLKSLVAALEERVQALESRPELEHKGPWRQGRAYGTGNLVQHSGACWLALDATTAKPGGPDEASRAWRLIAKSGQDRMVGTATRRGGLDPAPSPEKRQGAHD